MRVLHLTTSSQIAGAEQLLILTARHGPAFGHEHLFCTLQPPGPFHRAVGGEGATALSLGVQGGRDLMSAVPRLTTVLREHRVDLIHTHLFHGGVLGWAASRVGAARPRVHTRHYESYLHRYGRKWEVRLDRRATHSADVVVAISNAVRRVVVDVERVPHDRVRVIYNGIEPVGSLRDTRRRTLEPLLVAVGSLHECKGHRHLVEAMPLIRQRFPGARLRIYGEGRERFALELLIQSLHLKDSVELAGNVDDAFGALADADLVIQPSIEEGFGIAILEAMSQECAVVATGVGGIPEVVEDGVTGVLVPPADPHRLAATVADLLGDPERRRRMGVAGRQRLEGNFTVNSMLRGYAELYPQVAGAKRRMTARWGM